MKTIKIDRDVYNYLISKAAGPAEPPSLILRRELRLQQTETIEIDDDTHSYLLSKSVSFGESASDILRRELHLEESPHDPAGPIIFHIPAGTGPQPWNNRESTIVATVGDTLSIVNNDSVLHRLHTIGNPFPHPGSDILPGQTTDFLLQTPFDPVATGPLHDHAAGPTAEFWINVRPHG